MQRLREEALSLLANLRNPDIATALRHYLDYVVQRTN